MTRALALVALLLASAAPVVAQVTYPQGTVALPSHVIVDSCSGCGGSGVVGQATMAASAPVVIASDQSALNVNCLSGCGSPPATADGSAFTFGTTSVSPIGAVVDDVATTTVSENSFGAPRMSGSRVLYVDLSKTTVNATALKVDNSANTQPVSGTFFQATQPVSGTFFQATQPVSIATMPSTPVTGTFFQATQPVSIAAMPTTAVTGTFWQATQPVSNTQLPAALAANGGLKVEGIVGGVAVPTSLATLPALVAGSAVIGHVIVDTTSTTAVTQATGTNLHVVVDTAPSTAVTGPLTDTQIRATALPVSLTSTTITGTVTTSGTLTDTQLRASAVPVSLASAPTTAVTNAGLTNLDVALSTRTKPADQQHAILDSGTTAVTQATGTNLHTVTDANSVTVIQPSLAAADALTSAAKATVTSSVNVKASAGSVYGFSVVNGAGAGCWMELINSATAGTLGTAVIFNIALPTSLTLTVLSPIALGNFSAGIAVGVASAVGGAVACGTAATGITVFYK